MGWRFAVAGWLVASGCGRLAFDDVTGSTGTGDGGGNGDTPGMIGDGGSSGGCPAFAILCEDFESGNYNAWPLPETIGPSNLAVNMTLPHTGNYALDALKQASSNSGAADLARPFAPHSTGMLAVREWVNAQQALNNFNIVLSFGDLPNDNYVSLGGDDMTKWVISEDRAASGNTIDQSSAASTAMNQWFCVELLFTFGSPTTIQVRVDGTEVLNVNGITPSPTFDYVRVGVVRGDNPGFHAYVDDIVVAAQPIGCN